MKPARRSRQLATLTLALALTTLARARPASAQAMTGLDLVWEAPTGCPSEETVRKRVRALVGPTLDSATRVHAEGRIEPSGTRYRLTLRMGERGTETERVIESNSCSDLGGAAAVALGLLVRGQLEPSTGGYDDPSSNPNNSSENPANPAPSADANGERKQPPPPDKPKSDAPVTPVPAGEEDQALHFLLRAPLAGVDIGPLPAPNPTFGLAVGLRGGHLELTLGARLGLSQTVQADDSPPPYGADLSRVTAELRGCYLFGESFSAGPCVLAALHRLSAAGFGEELTTTRTEQAFGTAAGAGAVAKLQLAGSFSLVVCVGAELQATRERIVVEGLGDITTLSPFAFTMNGGLEFSP
ncbi:MAG TPA: hypothetical protein VG937_14155 [Polyangiaceae bacterium]|nr:hypothetical protein [Polyangiaceae bacterium]